MSYLVKIVLIAPNSVKHTIHRGLELGLLLWNLNGWNGKRGWMSPASFSPYRDWPKATTATFWYVCQPVLFFPVFFRYTFFSPNFFRTLRARIWPKFAVLTFGSTLVMLNVSSILPAAGAAEKACQYQKQIWKQPWPSNILILTEIIILQTEIWNFKKVYLKFPDILFLISQIGDILKSIFNTPKINAGASPSDHCSMMVRGNRTFVSDGSSVDPPRARPWRSCR